MKRRTFLSWLGGLVSASSVQGRWGQRAEPLDEEAVATLRRIGARVLPSSLGESGQGRVVTEFLRWLRHYSPGAKMPHQPGRTEAPRTPEIEIEAYRRQLRAIGAAERNAASLTTVLREALAEAGIEGLPRRPSGRHIVTDLMSFYFNSSEANDLCYRADIGRKTCRGLPGAQKEPPPLPGRRGRSG